MKLTCCACYVRAFSLVELFITLSIMGILMSLSLPSFSLWVRKTSIDELQDVYVATLNLAKQTAISKNVMVTLCPSSDAQNCLGNWADGSIAFMDHNKNAVWDEGEEIIARSSPNKHVANIYWRSFRNRNYLQITSQGFTNNQSGNFTFCGPDNKPEDARQLIINRLGRVRIAIDRNRDGIVEDSAGKAVRC